MIYVPVHKYGGLEHDQPAPVEGCLLCRLEAADGLGPLGSLASDRAEIRRLRAALLGAREFVADDEWTSAARLWQQGVLAKIDAALGNTTS